MTPKKMDLVCVTWHDAVHHQHGWVDEMKFAHIDDMVRSVGWIVRKDKRSITLAQSNGVSLVANTLQIPMGMVRKIVRIKI